MARYNKVEIFNGGMYEEKNQNFVLVWINWSCVGGTGNSQLLSLYNFLHDFRNNGGNIFKVYGVTREIFYEILDGKTYCGVIEKYPLKGQLNILDDFLDVKHKYYRTEEYEKMYGADFLEIQKIVECELEKMKMN